MKIGEFAKICNTKISVLRHYDKLDVLRPAYTDRFTEYRYYDSSQKAAFERIQELKSAGFSLLEIKFLLYSADAEQRTALFSQKRSQLEQTLHNLDSIRKKTFGGEFMEQKIRTLAEDINLPFENDEAVVGKWEIVCVSGEAEANTALGGKKRELYFLPGGEQYWCYGWTKGKLLYDDGRNTFANDYRLEERADGRYMTVEFKSFDYEETGEVTPVVLRKLDDRHYTRTEIARKDDLNKPFENDPRVLGRWVAYDFLLADEYKNAAYDPAQKKQLALCFREVQFFEGGGCTSVYDDETIAGDDMQTWTKGYLLRKWNSCACAYDIRTIGGRDYLILEWKSGDYRFGGRDTDYYVFVRA